ncbi:MAG: hypothetical protein CR972_01920 [Candidatus Moraniibacteriota bacterium]|nr:MAG: hypothetical protein CR972_01920 [Candidatus Moranbacteria bacterium]
MNATYKKILIIGSTILVVITLFILAATYVFRVESPVIDSVRKTLHLPAIIVDGVWISVAELEENTMSIKQFYENQDFSTMGIRIDFTTEDGKKRLLIRERKMLNKLIEDIAVEKIAEEWGITLSDEAVKAAMNRPMEQMGTREHVETKLKHLYGWSLDDFGDKVVRGQLLREKVSAKFEKENAVTDDMRTKVEKVQKELNDGRVFADVAMKYSEGQTAVDGGVMGWFREEQLQDEIGKNISQMNIGDISDVLETPLGLHIVRVNDISEEESGKLVHISQIIIKKKTFASFLSDRIIQMKVSEFLPTYEWETHTGLFVFSDQNMNDFEEKMRQEAMDTQKEMLKNNNI